MLGRRKRRERWEAVVLEVKRASGSGSDGLFTIGTVLLEVHPPGGEPYRATDSGMIRGSKRPQPGMVVPVDVDPRDPSDVEIAWDEVPTWGERAKAGDPAVTDPVGHQRAARQLAAEAADRRLDALHPGMAPHFQRVREMAQAAQPPAPPEREVAADPAPPGKLRGIARVVHRESRSKRGNLAKVVLSVQVPGRAPYGVEKLVDFKRIDVRGAGYPVLVSEDDPEEVEFLWDELPDEREQAAERMAEGIAQAQQQFGMIAGAWQAQANDAVSAYYEQALAAISDPEQRAAFKAQMRAAGWEVGEEP